MRNVFNEVYETLFDQINTKAGGAPTMLANNMAYAALMLNGKSPEETVDYLVSEAAVTEGVVAVTESERIREALDIAVVYGGIDGAHHKDWVIDQMCRVLSGPNYRTFVREACDGEDGPDTFEWSTGTPP